MTFNNKQELIDKIKEKQENAINALKFVSQQLTTKEGMFGKSLKEEKNKAYIDAYEDVIALIDSAKIVVYPEETGKAPTTSNDELDARQYAVEGLNRFNENQKLAIAYFGATKQDMKIKIIKSAYYSEFENDITDFIKNKNIIDIKFSVGSDYGMMNYCVMIIYKEDKSE